MKRQSYPMPGGTMSALHFNAEKGPVRLVFAHANGFNAQSYRAVLEKMNIHCIALDLRGHGMTELPTDPAKLKSWEIFARDIAVFVGRYVPGKIILAGHSMGAVSAGLAASQLKDRLAGYVGFDPVSIPWLGRVWPRLPGGRAYMKKRVPLFRKAGQRRREFESKEAAFKRYQGRGAFKGMSDDVVRDYVDGGFLPSDNGVKLACDPLWEQAIFCAQAHNMFVAAKSFPENTDAYYAGKFGVSSKKTRATLGRMIGAENIHFHADFQHMFPLQNPDFAAEALSRVITRANWD